MSFWLLLQKRKEKGKKPTQNQPTNQTKKPILNKSFVPPSGTQLWWLYCLLVFFPTVLKNTGWAFSRWTQRSLSVTKKSPPPQLYRRLTRKHAFLVGKVRLLTDSWRKAFAGKRSLLRCEALWWADDFDQLFDRTKDFSVTVSALSATVGLNLRTRVRVSSPPSAAFSSKPHLTHLILLIKLFWRH